MLPSVLQGQVVMSFSDVDAPRVVFDVVVPQVNKPGTAEKVNPSLDSMFTAYEPFQKNAGSYEPVYFLVGTDPEKSKFQISFKYRFFDADTSFAASYPWIQGLHLGYTQTSFWDLKSDSAPFEDTSYKPELFWLSQNYIQYEHGLLKGVFLQGGIQHESNGRGGDLSRSTNYLYIKPILVFYDDDSKLGLEVSPKIWLYVNNEDDTNADLPDYRGYFDLEVKFNLAESFEVGSQFRWADEGASLQLDFSYPLNNLFGDALDIYFFAQYTNALAESLLDFEDRTQVLRLGLALIR
jgi:outer membrane phospholipase A